jgi:hypothetical protein
MPHQNSHIQFGKDLFSNSIYSSKICLIIYIFFYLISLGYGASYPCHPLAPSMPWQQAAGKAKSALNWGESTVPELIPFRASATDCEGTGTDVM